MSQLWGNGARWEHDQGTHPHEAGLLKLDTSKARLRLGWTPKMRLSQALEWVVEWYQAYEANEDMREVTLGQISRYEEIPGD